MPGGSEFQAAIDEAVGLPSPATPGAQPDFSMKVAAGSGPLLGALISVTGTEAAGPATSEGEQVAKVTAFPLEKANLPATLHQPSLASSLVLPDRPLRQTASDNPPALAADGKGQNEVLHIASPGEPRIDKAETQGITNGPEAQPETGSLAPMDASLAVTTDSTAPVARKKSDAGEGAQKDAQPETGAAASAGAEAPLPAPPTPATLPAAAVLQPILAKAAEAERAAGEEPAQDRDSAAGAADAEAMPGTALPAQLPSPSEPSTVQPSGARGLDAAGSDPVRAKPSTVAPEATAATNAPVDGRAFTEALRSAAPVPGEAGAVAAQQPAHGASPAPAPTSAPPPTAPAHATITARPGSIGQEFGVEIARTAAAGLDELTVRLNPAEMGRIEVKLSFDERGSLRAVVAAESQAALDMLRRDSAELSRALADAGVRSDSQSFRFDSRAGSGGEGGQFWQRQQQASRANGHSYSDPSPTGEDPVYRPLRTSGRVDLMA